MVTNRRALGAHTTVLFGASQGKFPDGNSVLVQGSHSTVLIDPSLTVHEASPPLEVDQVLLTHTHEDHTAGLSNVRAGAISVHERDLYALRSLDGLMQLYGIEAEHAAAMSAMVQEKYHFQGWPQATGFTGGDTWDLGGVTVRALHTPGHTAGHCVFVIEPDDGSHRVVVTGDIDLTSFGPYYGEASSNLEDFEATLRMLRDLVADHYVTFHHKAIIDGHDAWVPAVDAFAAVIGRRDEAVLDLLAVPQTFDELLAVGIVYRPGTRPALFGDMVERYTIQRHLDRLVADATVATDGSQYWRA